jgi:hypothetical protein
MHLNHLVSELIIYLQISVSHNKDKKLIIIQVKESG